MDSALSQSTTLLNAQIGFLDTHLALIHIPTDAYGLFARPLIQLLLHNTQSDEDGQPFKPVRPWAFWHPFVNVSVTPNEWSIVCPRKEAEEVFRPVLDSLAHIPSESASISPEDYSVITIGGEGLEAGQRVLDLTSPLALAGIPIFFITSYWSDFVLVPYNQRSTVIHALQERGFEFERDANGEAGFMTNPASPLLHSHTRNGSSMSSFDFPTTPVTAPPTSVSEMQMRTFKLLKKHNITPYVDQSINLIACAGMKDSTSSSSTANFTEGKLQHGIVRCFTSPEPPRFFSLTLTDSESASLTLEKRLLPLFVNEGEYLLLGKDGPEQVPITLDLRDLPLESTGIVCGVASRLIDGMKGRIGRELFNMSYLSTARAGHVIVYQDELDNAMEALRGAQQNGVHEHDAV